MSDVDRMLSPGEQAAYRARLHWIIFGPPLIFFAGGLVAIPFHTIAAIGLLLVSIVAIFDAYVKFSTTEIVITNRRVVYKVGFLARRTIEMNKDKIELIDVSQSVLGRLLEFGTVMVKGTGGGIEAIHNVAAPFELRNHVAAQGTETPWMAQPAEPQKV